MTAARRVERVVVVHGDADPMLTYVLDLAGLSVVDEIGDVTVWAPCGLDAPLRVDLPEPAPDWPR